MPNAARLAHSVRVFSRLLSWRCTVWTSNIPERILLNSRLLSLTSKGFKAAFTLTGLDKRKSAKV